MLTLDPYAARGCPLKVHHRFHPGLVRPVPAERPTQLGLVDGSGFRSAVGELISAGTPSVADLSELAHHPREVQEAACRQAMTEGIEVILSGLLPSDWDGHRSGRADLLVRDPAGGYLPGIIRPHRMLDPRRDDRPYEYSELSQLPLRVAGTGWRYRWNQRWSNTLGLAHLWRLLEVLEHQARSGPQGVVIGTDSFEPAGLRASWLDLTEPAVLAAPGQLDGIELSSEAAPTVSALDRYDHEFALRVELAELAAAAEPDDPPLLHPVVTYQCSQCDWWPLCRAQLDDDDLSLRISKSRLDAHEIGALREIGISTVRQLADSDLEELLAAVLPVAAHRPGAEDRLRLAHRRSGMLARGVALERTTSGPIEVPRAELEIDIDIETSSEDRVYLWGFLITAGGQPARYQEFSDFSDLDSPSERRLAVQALEWLRETVQGRDALIYHYSDYEVTRIGRLAVDGDAALRWVVDFAAEHFVDLFELVRQHFFGAEGLGLKVVATAGAGFAWRDASPGGLNSMRWFTEAVHGATPEARRIARQRVLDYNEDDVTATARLRDWLGAQA